MLATIDLKTRGGLTKAVEAYLLVSSFSESELETLDILSNQEDKDLILCGIEESKNNKTYPIKSILNFQT